MKKSLVDSEDKALSDMKTLPRCEKCLGAGKNKGLFHMIECDSCVGLGVDISEPLRLITLLLSQNKSYRSEMKEFKRLMEQWNAPAHCSRCKSELSQAEAVESFYSVGSKYKHD